MSVLNLNAAEFEQQIEGSEGLALIDFYAEWCAPCKLIGPIVEDLAEDYEGKVKVVKINADNSPEVLAKYGVRGLPTLMIFKDGVPVDTAVGAQSAKAIKAFVEGQI
jgi:thioredoxin 1